MWDHYLHEEGLENGDIASDHYHRFEEDIRMMKEGGQNAYRFSLSWPRIIKNKAGEINEKGIAFITGCWMPVIHMELNRL